jgi:hypothetical protein
VELDALIDKRVKSKMKTRKLFFPFPPFLTFSLRHFKSNFEKYIPHDSLEENFDLLNIDMAVNSKESVGEMVVQSKTKPEAHPTTVIRHSCTAQLSLMFNFRAPCIKTYQTAPQPALISLLSTLRYTDHGPEPSNNRSSTNSSPMVLEDI